MPAVAVEKSLAQGVLGILGSIASNPTTLLSVVGAIAGGPLSPIVGLAITYGLPVVIDAIKVISTPTITEEQILAEISKMPDVRKLDLKTIWG